MMDQTPASSHHWEVCHLFHRKTNPDWISLLSHVSASRKDAQIGSGSHLLQPTTSGDEVSQDQLGCWRLSFVGDWQLRG